MKTDWCSAFSSVCLFVTPWTAAHQAFLSVIIPWSLLKLMSIESVMPSNHLILSSPSPPALNLTQNQVFSNESALHIMWPKHWSFSFTIGPSNEYSGLISSRFDLLDVQGTLKSPLHTIVQKHQFFGTQLSLWPNSHIHT